MPQEEIIRPEGGESDFANAVTGHIVAGTDVIARGMYRQKYYVVTRDGKVVFKPKIATYVFDIYNLLIPAEVVEVSVWNKHLLDRKGSIRLSVNHKLKLIRDFTLSAAAGKIDLMAGTELQLKNIAFAARIFSLAVFLPD